MLLKLDYLYLLKAKVKLLNIRGMEMRVYTEVVIVIDI